VESPASRKKRDVDLNRLKNSPNTDIRNEGGREASQFMKTFGEE